MLIAHATDTLQMRKQNAIVWQFGAHRGSSPKIIIRQFQADLLTALTLFTIISRDTSRHGSI
jgi:hypothetical protein